MGRKSFTELPGDCYDCIYLKMNGLSGSKDGSAEASDNPALSPDATSRQPGFAMAVLRFCEGCGDGIWFSAFFSYHVSPHCPDLVSPHPPYHVSPHIDGERSQSFWP